MSLIITPSQSSEENGRTLAQKPGAIHGEIVPLTSISANTLPAYQPQYLDSGIEVLKLLILANTQRLLLNKQQRKSKN